MQSPVHSAHIGQEVEVHYRWHSLYGRRVRQQSSEQRASGRVVHVETAPGVIIVLAAWMLDPAACAGMEIGAPHAEAAALIDLHRLLVERGFRRSSLGDLRIAKEEQNDQFAPWAISESPRRSKMINSPKPVPIMPAPSVVPRQLNIVFDSVRLRGMNTSDRAKAVAYLATLLMQAAGVATRERNDDER
jgi:hypothetical protein